MDEIVPIRPALWGSHLLSEQTRAYARMHCTHVQFMVHVDDPGPNAYVEFFDSYNYPGIRNIDLVRKAVEDGHRIIVVIDWHHGNGLMDKTRFAYESPTGFGKYHGLPISEGGVRSAIIRAASWIKAVPGAKVDAVIIGNEQKGKAEVYGDLVKRMASQVVASFGLGTGVWAGGDGDHLMAAAMWADALTIHPLHSPRLSIQDGLAAANRYACPIIANEAAATGPWSIGYLYEQLLKEKRIIGIGTFVGSDQPRAGTFWNGRSYRPAFTCFADKFLTVQGAAYEEMVSGNSRPAPPPQPEPGDIVITRQQALDRLNSRLNKSQDLAEVIAQELVHRASGGDPVRNLPRLRGRRVEIKREIEYLGKMLGVTDGVDEE